MNYLGKSAALLFFVDFLIHNFFLICRRKYLALRDENSVCDEESSIGRGLKRQSSAPMQYSQPKSSKFIKDQKEQIGHVVKRGKKSEAVPEEVSTSIPEIFEATGSVTIQKAIKKPKGKGFSKGTYGDKTVVVHKLPQNKSTTCNAKSNSDVSDTAIEKPKKRKYGGSNIGRKSNNAEKKSSQRYFPDCLCFTLMQFNAILYFLGILRQMNNMQKG